MPFEKGKQKTGGRRAGTPNRRTVEFQKTLDDYDFNPAEALVALFEQAMIGVEHGNRNEKPVYIKIAADIAKELASYVCPKLKAIEITIDKGINRTEQAEELLSLSDDQLGKAMRERLKLVSGKDV